MEDSQKALPILIQGVKLGQRAAQKALYEHYYAYAKSICYQYTSNEQEAVEILNDGFLKILMNIELYDPEFSFKAWLRKIMINKSIDYYRKNKSAALFSTLDSLDAGQASFSDYPDLDDIEDLVPALRKLSPGYRIVLNLYILEEYSHEEIAEKLQISPSTSRSSLSRALSKLKEILDPKLKSVKN